MPASDPVSWCDTRFLATVDEAAFDWVRREDFVGDASWRVERVRAAGSDPGGWRLTEPEPARPAWAFAGDSLVRTLVDLRAADVIGRADEDPARDAARYGFAEDRFTVGIRGETFRFELGSPAAPGQRYLRVRNLPWIYTLSDFEVGQLRQPVEAMLPPEREEEPGDGGAEVPR